MSILAISDAFLGLAYRGGTIADAAEVDKASASSRTLHDARCQDFSRVSANKESKFLDSYLLYVTLAPV